MREKLGLPVAVGQEFLLALGTRFGLNGPGVARLLEQLGQIPGRVRVLYGQAAEEHGNPEESGA